MFIYTYQHFVCQFYNKYKTTGKRKDDWNKNILQTLQESLYIQRKQ